MSNISIALFSCLSIFSTCYSPDRSIAQTPRTQSSSDRAADEDRPCEDKGRSVLDQYRVEFDPATCKK